MKLTPEIIESRIVDESFLEIVPRQTVIAVLRLQNGTVVIGEAHTLSPENFVYEVGCRVAREDAVRKIWALEGYAAREAKAQHDEALRVQESMAAAAATEPSNLVPPDGC